MLFKARYLLKVTLIYMYVDNIWDMWIQPKNNNTKNYKCKMKQ